MNSRIMKQLIVPYVLLSMIAFAVLVNGLSPDTLIMTLNALFVGTMVSISVTYGTILVPAIFGIRPYDEVRVLAIGIFGGWLAYGMVVMASVYVRASDLPTTSLLLTSVGRWIAINSAVIQIVAPDFNQDRSFAYGRDRKLLIFGLCAGLVFALVTYMIQVEEVLN